jgi:hypothetical protein
MHSADNVLGDAIAKQSAALEQVWYRKAPLVSDASIAEALLEFAEANGITVVYCGRRGIHHQNDSKFKISFASKGVFVYCLIFFFD